MSRPLIIQYLELLHKYRDPNVSAVRKFVEACVADEAFIARMQVLRRIFVMKLVLEGGE